MVSRILLMSSTEVFLAEGAEYPLAVLIDYAELAETQVGDNLELPQGSDNNFSYSVTRVQSFPNGDIGISGYHQGDVRLASLSIVMNRFRLRATLQTSGARYQIRAGIPNKASKQVKSAADNISQATR